MDADAPRELYMEYRALTEQLQKIQEYLEHTTENIAEVGNVLAALDDFSRLAPGSRVFAPLANGIFIDATLNDSSMLRMNVGGGVVVEKPVAEAKKILEGQRTELEELHERATKDRAGAIRRLHEIEAMIESEQSASPAVPANAASAQHHQAHKQSHPHGSHAHKK